MLRSALIASLMFAAASAGAAAEEQHPGDTRQAQAEDEFAPQHTRGDRFVMMSDACGASRYAHLIGRNYAQMYEAALLPSDSVVQNRHMWRTLEYTPYQLNVVVGGTGEIVAIGCF